LTSDVRDDEEEEVFIDAPLPPLPPVTPLPLLLDPPPYKSEGPLLPEEGNGIRKTS
jgi:hypothetical protein